MSSLSTRLGWAAVALPLAALALIIGVTGDSRDRVDPGTGLIDVVVVERRTGPGDDAVVLRVSDPNVRRYCTVLRDAFARDWPRVGDAFPVEYRARTCHLRRLREGAPTTALIAGGLLGLTAVAVFVAVTLAGHRRRETARRRVSGRAERVVAEARRRRAKAGT